MTISRAIRSMLSHAAPAAFLALTLASASQAQMTLRVVHGIPGRDVAPAVDPDLPVDVLVNDAICLLQGFTFGEVAGPFSLPGDVYNVKVSLANSLTPCSEGAVIDADVPLNDGENATIVAHLTEDGAPTAGKFLNDVSVPGPQNARITAHHLAAAPAVDIRVNGGFLPRNLVEIPGAANGAQASAEVRGSSVTVGIAPAGERATIFVRSLLLKAGPTYNVYAVGSLANGTFTLVVDQIGGLEGFAIRF